MGLLPFGIGVKKLLDLRKGDDDREDFRGGHFEHSKVLSVAAVTFANGGDNISIYVPLFSTRPFAQVTVMVGVFLLMTRLWCAVAHWLINYRSLGNPLRKYGRLLLPWVLMGLGVYILLDAHTLALLRR